MSVRTDLPAPVLGLIEQSFNDRISKVPNSGVVFVNRPVPASGINKLKNVVMSKIDNIVVKPNDYSGGNLDNAFEKTPVTLDDLLERCMSLRDLNNVTKIFERCRLVTTGANVTTDAIWDGLRWVRRGWSTGSYGFDFSYKDRVLQRQLYDQLVLERRLVRDTPKTGAEHPGCSPWLEILANVSAKHPPPRDREYRPGLFELFALDHAGRSPAHCATHCARLAGASQQARWWRELAGLLWKTAPLPFLFLLGEGAIVALGASSGY